jgi:hypothetical protein
MPQKSLGGTPRHPAPVSGDRRGAGEMQESCEREKGQTSWSWGNTSTIARKEGATGRARRGNGVGIPARYPRVTGAGMDSGKLIAETIGADIMK